MPTNPDCEHYDHHDGQVITGQNDFVSVREPTLEERDELFEWYQVHHGLSADNAANRAYETPAAVFPNYVSEGPGYAGRVMVVIHAYPSFVDVFTWDEDGELVREDLE